MSDDGCFSGLAWLPFLVSVGCLFVLNEYPVFRIPVTVLLVYVFNWEHLASWVNGQHINPFLLCSPRLYLNRELPWLLLVPSWHLITLCMNIDSQTESSTSIQFHLVATAIVYYTSFITLSLTSSQNLINKSLQYGRQTTVWFVMLQSLQVPMVAWLIFRTFMVTGQLTGLIAVCVGYPTSLVTVTVQNSFITNVLAVNLFKRYSFDGDCCHSTSGERIVNNKIEPQETRNHNEDEVECRATISNELLSVNSLPTEKSSISSINTDSTDSELRHRKVHDHQSMRENTTKIDKANSPEPKEPLHSAAQYPNEFTWHVAKCINTAIHAAFLITSHVLGFFLFQIYNCYIGLIFSLTCTWLLALTSHTMCTLYLRTTSPLQNHKCTSINVFADWLLMLYTIDVYASIGALVVLWSRHALSFLIFSPNMPLNASLLWIASWLLLLFVPVWLIKSIKNHKFLAYCFGIWSSHVSGDSNDFRETLLDRQDGHVHNKQFTRRQPQWDLSNGAFISKHNTWSLPFYADHKKSRPLDQSEQPPVNRASDVRVVTTTQAFIQVLYGFSCRIWSMGKQYAAEVVASTFTRLLLICGAYDFIVDVYSIGNARLPIKVTLVCLFYISFTCMMGFLLQTRSSQPSQWTDTERGLAGALQDENGHLIAQFQWNRCLLVSLWPVAVLAVVVTWVTTRKSQVTVQSKRQTSLHIFTSLIFCIITQSSVLYLVVLLGRIDHASMIYQFVLLPVALNVVLAATIDVYPVCADAAMRSKTVHAAVEPQKHGSVIKHARSYNDFVCRAGVTCVAVIQIARSIATSVAQMPMTWTADGFIFVFTIIMCYYPSLFTKLFKTVRLFSARLLLCEKYRLVALRSFLLVLYKGLFWPTSLAQSICANIYDADSYYFDRNDHPAKQNNKKQCDQPNDPCVRKSPEYPFLSGTDINKECPEEHVVIYPDNQELESFSGVQDVKDLPLYCSSKDSSDESIPKESFDASPTFCLWEDIISPFLNTVALASIRLYTSYPSSLSIPALWIGQTIAIFPFVPISSKIAKRFNNSKLQTIFFHATVAIVCATISAGFITIGDVLSHIFSSNSYTISVTLLSSVWYLAQIRAVGNSISFYGLRRLLEFLSILIWTLPLFAAILEIATLFLPTASYIVVHTIAILLQSGILNPGCFACLAVLKSDMLSSEKRHKIPHLKHFDSLCMWFCIIYAFFGILQSGANIFDVYDDFFLESSQRFQSICWTISLLGFCMPSLLIAVRYQLSVLKSARFSTQVDFVMHMPILFFIFFICCSKQIRTVTSCLMAYYILATYKYAQQCLVGCNQSTIHKLHLTAKQRDGRSSTVDAQINDIV